MLDLLNNLIEFFDLRNLLIAAVILIPLERLFALRPQQAILRRHWLNDLVYVLVNRIPILLGVIGFLTFVFWLTPLVVPAGLRGWVGGLPLWAQLPAAVLLADLGFYGAHRAFHTPALWRFHAVHHSIEEMDWLAAARVHPVDQIVTKSVSLVPLYMLGFSPETIAIHSAIYFVQSYLLHANLRITLGPLRWLVASPEFHHWHHSNQREAYDKNFASQLPFLDLLFGTAHMPRGQMPAVYGVNDPVPTTYLRQMAYPFLRRKRRRAAKASAPVATPAGEG